MIAAPSLGDLLRKCEQKKVMTQSPRGLVYHPKGIAIKKYYNELFLKMWKQKRKAV